VWPTAPLEILSEDLAPGWHAEPRSLEELTLAQSGTVCTGTTACAIQTKSSFAGWTLQLQADEPVDPFGYEGLHLAIHPGDLAPGDKDRLTLSLGGGTEPVNLLAGGLIDWSSAEWQYIDLSFAELGAEGSISGLQFYGTPAGTFYIDEFRLDPGQAPVLPGTAVTETRTATIPGAFSLQQNYPNPFNSNTALRFALPEATHVELSVYNSLGQQVATLVQGAREAGTYSVAWDGKDNAGRPLATGGYLYRLRAGNQTEARRLLLLR